MNTIKRKRSHKLSSQDLNSQTPTKKIHLNDKCPKPLVKIASLSQPGINSGKRKVNQDSYLVSSSDKQSFISVMDGHGDHGHRISNYLKENMPTYFDFFELNKINQTKIQQIKNKFNDLNEQLINKIKPKIMCKSSGSTCVSVIVTENHILCANSGDSRAIIGTYNSNSRKNVNFYCLSEDHKPENQQEKDRVLATGGEIHAMAFEDEYYGCQRIWIKNKDYPGLALTRGFADTMAHSIGLICEPEIKVEQLEYKIQDLDDKKSQQCIFLVVASDGVWEFLSNQEVSDIIYQYYQKGDVEGACQEVINQADRKWRDEDKSLDEQEKQKKQTNQKNNEYTTSELYIDDITISIAFFEDNVYFSSLNEISE